MKMEQIECSETSAYINQTPGNYPKENKLYSEHGESLKSRIHHFNTSHIFYMHQWFVDVCSFVYLLAFLCNYLKVLDNGPRWPKKVIE